MTYVFTGTGSSVAEIPNIFVTTERNCCEFHQAIRTCHPCKGCTHTAWFFDNNGFAYFNAAAFCFVVDLYANGISTWFFVLVGWVLAGAISTVAKTPFVVITAGAVSPEFGISTLAGVKEVAFDVAIGTTGNFNLFTNC